MEPADSAHHHATTAPDVRAQAGWAEDLEWGHPCNASQDPARARTTGEKAAELLHVQAKRLDLNHITTPKGVSANWPRGLARGVSGVSATDRRGQGFTGFYHHCTPSPKETGVCRAVIRHGGGAGRSQQAEHVTCGMEGEAPVPHSTAATTRALHSHRGEMTSRQEIHLLLKG